MARSFWEICGLRRPVEDPVEDPVTVGAAGGGGIGLGEDVTIVGGDAYGAVKQKPFVADFARKGILSGCEVLDVYSPTWVFVKSTIKKRLTELRKKNDTLTLSERKTHIVRGRIAELEKLLKLPDADKK